MKIWRVASIVVLLALSLPYVDPASAARRAVVRRGRHGRAVVVVHRGWPLRRPLRAVVVRPARVVYRVQPGVFLAPVIWPAAVIVTRPAAGVWLWEDAETFDRADDWTEVTLTCGQRGKKIDLEIADGKAQFDWAEVVFANGETQVVDFSEKTHGPGLYSLLDFADGREVDHVRMVARAKSDRARVVLRLER